VRRFNKLTDAEDAFKTAAERDKMIKLGTHENLELKLVLQKRRDFLRIFL
jgi:hypothetical protein